MAGSIGKKSAVLVKNDVNFCKSKSVVATGEGKR